MVGVAQVVLEKVQAAWQQAGFDQFGVRLHNRSEGGNADGSRRGAFCQ